jgi:EcoRII C terminal
VKADGDTTVDFLFPKLLSYQGLAANAPAGCGVVSLASKSTIKERWRQVLREARKLSQKHLCTLQPGISQAQIAEMNDAGVVLVIPRAFQSSYKPGTATVLSVSDFIDRVRAEVR